MHGHPAKNQRRFTEDGPRRLPAIVWSSESTAPHAALDPGDAVGGVGPRWSG